MKKIYITPSVEVVKISVAQMLASSPIGTDVNGDAPGGSEGFSREGYFDEEED